MDYFYYRIHVNKHDNIHKSEAHQKVWSKKERKILNITTVILIFNYTDASLGTFLTCLKL